MSIPKPDYSRLIPAMIALGRTDLPPIDKLAAQLQEVAGLDVNLGQFKASDEGLMIGLGNDRAAVALSRTPIPWSAVEGPAEMAWWWPEATEVMRSHKAHFLVVVAGEPGNRIERHHALTQFTAAVASLCDARGIYWVAGGLVHEPRSFIAEARRGNASGLPLELWIDIRIEPLEIGPLEAGGVRMFTTGMRALGDLELEIAQTTRPKSEILDFTKAVAQHILTTSDQIEDGHTLGRSEEEKVVISKAISMLDPKLTVWRLEFA